MAPKSALKQDAGPIEKDWLAEARSMLIAGGISAVEINPLAARLGVTRGGFYWRFRNRQDLLDQLLHDWEETNTASFIKAVSPPGDARERVARLRELWLGEEAFIPEFDIAVREWGRVEPAVQARVAKADKRRLEALKGLYLDLGAPTNEALVRARILYFHQMGYYALGLKESRHERETLYPIYERLLFGAKKE
jgi:AcrR family transcriptional regulator